MVINFKHNDIRKALYKLLDVVDCMQHTAENHTTDSEKKMLIEFLLLDPERFGIYRFSRWARESVTKQAQEEINWKLSKRNIANKVSSLLIKGLLYKESDKQVFIKKWLLRAASDLIEAHYKKEKYEIKFRFNNGS